MSYVIITYGQKENKMRMMHLHKNGGGMAAKTACGRNIIRTPMSTDWVGFTSEPSESQCSKCVNSKYFAFLTRTTKNKPL